MFYSDTHPKFLKFPTHQDLIEFYKNYQSDDDFVVSSAVVAKHKAADLLQLIRRRNISLKANRRLLDYGCGCGHLLAEFGQALGFSELYGTEFSSTKVQMAERISPAGKYYFVEGDRLPFPDDFFDYAVFADVIEHVIDPVQMIKELKRVTRHGIFMIVPLEKNWEHVGHLARNTLAIALKGRDRTLLRAFGGHIHFWNHYSFKRFAEPYFKKVVYYCSDNPLEDEYKRLNCSASSWRSSFALIYRRFIYRIVRGNGQLYSLFCNQSGNYFCEKT